MVRRKEATPRELVDAALAGIEVVNPELNSVVNILDEQADREITNDCINVLHDTIKLCEELGHEVVEASPQIDVEAHSFATLRVWSANLANMMNGVSKALNRVPSEENLEAASFACYQYGQAMTAPELLEAIDIMAMVTRSVGQFFTKYDIFITYNSPTASPSRRIKSKCYRN